MSKFRFLTLSLSILLLSTALSAQTARAQAPQTDPRTVVADTVFVTETGKQVRLSDYHGKVVLVYFWGSWCPH